MPNLVRDLVVAGVSYTLLFRKVVSPSGAKYFVSAFHQIEDQVSFEMKQEASGSWRVVLPAPDWVLQNQPAISGMINSHQSN